MLRGSEGEGYGEWERLRGTKKGRGYRTDVGGNMEREMLRGWGKKTK